MSRYEVVTDMETVVLLERAGLLYWHECERGFEWVPFPGNPPLRNGSAAEQFHLERGRFGVRLED